LVERYDRCRNKEGHVIRLHQEDFCQAMHRPPEQKYENEGGPTLEQCFALLDTRIQSGTMAGRNKLTLLRAVAFNFLIGNGDAHGKNFSLLYDGKAEAFAPLYDLMCTVVYSNAFKTKMAMRLGRKYRFKDVAMHHFERLGESVGFKIDFTRKQVLKVSNDVVKASALLADSLNHDPKTASVLYEKMVKVIKKHYQQIVVDRPSDRSTRAIP